MHGADDPLVDVSGGRATARAIPGAELVVFDGMGHDLPPRAVGGDHATHRCARASAPSAGRGVTPR